MIKTFILSVLKSKKFEKLVFSAIIVVSIILYSDRQTKKQVTPLLAQIETLTELVSELSKQPKNAITNNIDRTKAKDGSDINLNINSELTDDDISLPDSTAKPEKATGFKKVLEWFKRKK